MVEAPAEPPAQSLVERLLAGVPERRVPEVVAEPDRLDEVLVQPQRPRDAARDPGRLERVGQARAVVVAGRVDEDLRLVHQAPERLGVDDPVAVALERRPQARLRPRRARPRVSYERTASGESHALLVLANARLEGVRESVRRAPASAPMLAARPGSGTAARRAPAPPTLNLGGA